MDRDDPYFGVDIGESRGRDNSPWLHLLSYAEMASLPEPEWLIDGVIQKRSAALAFGKSNTFKSFLAVDIGCSVASGRLWHGHQVARGNVLFVATEGGNGVGRLRIPSWYDHYGIPEERRTAFLYPQEIALDKPKDVSSLIDAMRRDGPFVLLVLDIFGGTMSGSEIEDTTARAWVNSIQRIIREAGAAILTIAHTGWQDDTRARMHTHFWGSFDTRLKVDGDKDAMTTVLSVERHKDADSAGQWGFRLVSVGKSLVPVLDGGVKPAKSGGLSGQSKIALNALDEAVINSGVMLAGKDWPACRIVKIDEWRVMCERHGLCDKDNAESRRKAFQRARQTLIDRNMIRSFDGYVWRCD